MNTFQRKSLKTGLKVVVSITILVFILFQAKKEIEGISIKNAFLLFKSLSSFEIGSAITVGLLAVSFMFFYDLILTRSLRLPISIKKTFKISWMANTLNGLLGFGGVIGAWLRVFFYKQHTDEQEKVIQGVTFMAFSMLSGLSLLSIFVLLNVFHAKPLLETKKWLYIALFGVLLFLPFYLFTTFRMKKENDDRFLGLKFTVISTIEWIGAAFTAYYTLHLMGQNVSLPIVFGVFFSSAIAGLVSMIPGGFGTFDLMYLIGMTSHGLSEELVLSSLLLYRIVYYFIPFGLGLLLSIIEFGENAIKMFEDKPIIGPAIETSNVILSLQKGWISKIPFFSISIVIAITGFYCLVAGFNSFYYASELQGNQFLLGLELFFSSCTISFSIIILLQVKAVIKETKRSFFSILISLAGLIVSLTITDGTIFEIGWLTIVFIILYSIYKKLKRIRTPITLYKKMFSTLFVVAVYYVYYVFIQTAIEYANKSDLVVDKNAMYATFFLSIVILTIAGTAIYIFFERHQHEKLEMEVNEELLKDILHTYGGTYLSHLAFSHQLSFFLGMDKRAFLQFSTIGHTAVVLGDPAGRPESFYPLLSEFYEKADTLGYEIIFYQTHQKYMGMYHDFGNIFFKLGEEAIIDLEKFNLSGKKNAGLRATINKYKREGYQFSVIDPPYTDKLFQELEEVSKKWLGKRREKGFSVGFFDREYLSKAPVAILRDKDERLMAFASIMPAYQNGVLSIDLMRYLPNGPGGLMDALFIHLFDWAKEKGYHTFNMGMAPLSKVGETRNSFLRERIAANVFENIQYMYSFAGLRKFKEKYGPQWEPRYMVYSKYQSLPLKMIAVGRLINKPKGPRPSEMKHKKQRI
ncbi:putative lysylphosphatidylglycerol synthetase MprF [Bacillus methanolicus PB1]|uniref:Phosphatidylglycerol lysyltransferase n=1 Tax=Bacillus methanolicus PB1 TaxID=997296 RepID=I3DXD6_BACMT|nr:bifunctional lysylphosphatidylglycerol flippase/synthetase MprF [Bacillus methanolicus]EIJ78907.1 putative lysylphosphatidylglycerol synthetase MprF [Bacillus methanolicus PB1]